MNLVYSRKKWRVVMRISTEIEGGQTFVKCKVGWTEMIISRELKIFDKRLIRGLMKPSVKGERRIEYAVPNGITLKAYLNLREKQHN